MLFALPLSLPFFSFTLSFCERLGVTKNSHTSKAVGGLQTQQEQAKKLDTKQIIEGSSSWWTPKTNAASSKSSHWIGRRINDVLQTAICCFGFVRGVGISRLARRNPHTTQKHTPPTAAYPPSPIRWPPFHFHTPPPPSRQPQPDTSTDHATSALFSQWHALSQHQSDNYHIHHHH